MNVKALSLKAYAEAATAAATEGTIHGNLAAEGKTMDPAQLANIEKAALAGDRQYAEVLEFLDEARQATFTNAFARAGYFRAMLAHLSTVEKPDPEQVLSTFFSARAKNFIVLNGTERESRHAIPLFRTFEDRDEARKFLGKNILPIRVSDSNREKQGTSQEHIEGTRFKFLTPTTVEETECYEHMRKLFARMPEVLANYFDEHTNFDVRQAVWLTLNLYLGARVFHPKAAGRMFEESEGELSHKDGGAYVKFELSNHETLILNKDKLSERIVAQLSIFAKAMERTLRRK